MSLGRTSLFSWNGLSSMARKVYKPDDPMWVIGCIDAYGAIRARAVPSMGRIMHGPEESMGKRWRWNIWGQDWCATKTQDQLTDEELQIVKDWLVRRGHMYE